MLVGRATVDGQDCDGLFDAGLFRVVAGDVFGDWSYTGRSVPADDIEVLPPSRSDQILSGGGYLVEGETRAAPARPPNWRFKRCEATGDGAQIPFPAGIEGPLWVECELAVVVGTTLRDVGVAEARRGIFGWTLLNDVTAPELQNGGDWTEAKSMPGFAPFGPWIRTDLSEERVLQGLDCILSINHDEVGRDNTRDLRYTPAEMLSVVSHHTTLRPGAVLSLGTQPPLIEANVGDEVTLMIEEIGAMTNWVVSGRADDES